MIADGHARDEAAETLEPRTTSHSCCTGAAIACRTCSRIGSLPFIDKFRLLGQSAGFASGASGFRLALVQTRPL